MAPRPDDFSKIDTVIKLFERSVALYGDRPLILEKRNGQWEQYSYAAIQREAQNCAAGLLRLGLVAGDRIAILAEGRKDWLVAELGMFYARLVNVPLSVKLDAEAEIAFRLEHSGARMIIVSATQAAKIQAIAARLPQLEQIIYFDLPSEDIEDEALTFASVCSKGHRWLADETNRIDFENSVALVSGDDLANISYTSGTTADPKGIMLTQRNYAANTYQSRSRIYIEKESVTLTILPWDHSFAHTTCLYAVMSYGAAIAAQEIGRTPIETLKNIPKNIREVRPTLIMSVPALSKAFRKNIESAIRSKGVVVRKLYSFFKRVGYAYNGDWYNRGNGWRAMLKPLYALGDAMIFSTIRKGFGGRLEFFIGGGALLDIELQRFFACIGMPVMQGYGLSEAAPVISTNALNACKFGSSGLVVDHMQLKICDAEGNELPAGEKGEIVIKGDNVMQGYWRNEEATAEALRDGWLHTGDMGYRDADGFLFVLGRFKSLLISSDGEKYSPEGIEEAIIEASPLIEQFMLYNNQNPYTVAFLVPNASALKAALAAEGHTLGDIEGRMRALAMLQREVAKFRQGGERAGEFPERWLPAAIAVLPEAFTEQNGLINSSLKVVRGKVVEHFASMLLYLYTPTAKNFTNEANLTALERWK